MATSTGPLLPEGPQELIASMASKGSQIRIGFKT